MAASAVEVTPSAARRRDDRNALVLQCFRVLQVFGIGGGEPAILSSIMKAARQRPPGDQCQLRLQAWLRWHAPLSLAFLPRGYIRRAGGRRPGLRRRDRGHRDVPQHRRDRGPPGTPWTRRNASWRVPQQSLVEACCPAYRAARRRLGRRCFERRAARPTSRPVGV